MRFIVLGFSTIFVARTTYAQSGPAQCYFANGTPLPPSHSEYQPCTSGPSTICCGINRTNPPRGDAAKGFTMDECMPSGLCQNRLTRNGAPETTWWLNFCTNADIASGNCLNVCGSTRNDFGITPMTPCTGRADSDRWCCGATNACCASNVGVVTLAKVLKVSNMTNSMRTSSRISSTSSATASSSFGMTPEFSVPPPAGASKEESISGGIIAGIVVVAIAGVVLLTAAIFFARRAAMYKKQAMEKQHFVEAPGIVMPVEAPLNRPEYEVQGCEKYHRHELPPALPVELPVRMAR